MVCTIHIFSPGFGHVKYLDVDGPRSLKELEKEATLAIKAEPRFRDFELVDAKNWTLNTSHVPLNPTRSIKSYLPGNDGNVSDINRFEVGGRSGDVSNNQANCASAKILTPWTHQK